MSKIGIMAHMIPWYPDAERSRRVAQALIDAGVTYLEIQFPFSDPTADGPTIQAACSAALERGFSLSAGWDFVAELVAAGAPPIFVMSYASPVYTTGVERFVKNAAEIGVRGLIVPDLPFDADEGLYAAGERADVAIVPVLAPDTRSGRLAKLEALHPEYVYASLRRGITGTRTEIGPDNITFLERARALGGEVMAGFGIVERAQVDALAEHCDVAVVGSELVRTIPSDGDPYEPVRSLAVSLV